MAKLVAFQAIAVGSNPTTRTGLFISNFYKKKNQLFLKVNYTNLLFQNIRIISLF